EAVTANLLSKGTARAVTRAPAVSAWSTGSEGLDCKARKCSRRYSMFDVIVVGGRCAGAATALLLARKGFKVLVVDRAQFPADIPHGHFIRRQAPMQLHPWGLLDEIVRAGGPPVTKVTTDFGDFPLTGTNLFRDGVALGYGPRRGTLDAILIEAATAAGAEFRDGFSVDEYLFDGAAVAGIRGRSHESGSQISERA